MSTLNQCSKGKSKYGGKWIGALQWKCSRLPKNKTAKNLKQIAMHVLWSYLGLVKSAKVETINMSP